MKLQIPFGKLPTKAQFNRACLEQFHPNQFIRLIDFGGNSRSIKPISLWGELQAALSINTEDSLKWAKKILHSINIEWI